MWLPQGFDKSHTSSLVCKLHKSLYGLKQSSRQLTNVLLNSSYKQSEHDYSLFTKRDGTKCIYLLIYVDDLLITGSDSAMVTKLKSVLRHNFKLKDLGELRYFFTIEIQLRELSSISRSMPWRLFWMLVSLVRSLLPLRWSNICSLPLGSTINLFPAKRMILFFKMETSFIGLLVVYFYLTMSQCSVSSNSCINRSSLTLLLLCVLFNTLNVHRVNAFFYPISNPISIDVYCDSNWATCPFNRRSINDYCVKIEDDFVSWKVKRQSTVSRSSVKVEYRSIGFGGSKDVWLRGLLAELGFPQIEPVVCYCDNKSAHC